MFRILALAALLATPETALAAKAGFKSGIKPVPFRAHGLFAPVTPRTLSHPGLPAKFHGHLPKRVVQPAIVGLTGGGLALFNPTPLADTIPDQAIGRAVLVPVGGMTGCTTEDVAVSGKTISVIRC